MCLPPGGDCTDAIIQSLSDATHTILVQAYAFTSAPMTKALLDAHTRGVQVQVILHKSQRTELYASADFLANQGVPIMIDADHAISHNKIIIIDRETVITGSFNFTKAAQEKNAENVLIIHDPALAAQYTQNWEAHQRHRLPSMGRGVRRSWQREVNTAATGQRHWLWVLSICVVILCVGYYQLLMPSGASNRAIQSMIDRNNANLLCLRAGMFAEYVSDTMGEPQCPEGYPWERSGSTEWR